MKKTYLVNEVWEIGERRVVGSGPGGVLPYNSYSGMCRPTGSYFWDSDLKRGIIFRTFSERGTTFQMHESFQILSTISRVERGFKNLPIF